MTRMTPSIDRFSPRSGVQVTTQVMALPRRLVAGSSTTMCSSFPARQERIGLCS
jgi:hypothetical protein